MATNLMRRTKTQATETDSGRNIKPEQTITGKGSELVIYKWLSKKSPGAGSSTVILTNI